MQKSKKPAKGVFPDRVATDASVPEVILTIGHSNRSIEQFLELLRAHGVGLLADVRKMPGSQKNPQFNREALSRALREAEINYVHLPGLGGLRRPAVNSPNAGWKNASFRAYADYMLTPEFETILHQLLELARDLRTALMCAEAVPWRCHRSLIADALVARGVRVEDILTGARSQPHVLRSFAHVEGTRITYPLVSTQESS